MKFGFRASLTGGRIVSITPTRHLLPDIQPVNAEKKAELERIVQNKPVVDKLISKVATLKVKPNKQTTEKEIIQQQREYKKTILKKPKKRISLDL